MRHAALERDKVAQTEAGRLAWKKLTCVAYSTADTAHADARPSWIDRTPQPASRNPLSDRAKPSPERRRRNRNRGHKYRCRQLCIFSPIELSKQMLSNEEGNAEPHAE
jgi:hypothetical protein